jgi:hypothetical protein
MSDTPSFDIETLPAGRWRWSKKRLAEIERALEAVAVAEEPLWQLVEKRRRLDREANDLLGQLVKHRVALSDERDLCIRAIWRRDRQRSR